MTESVTGSMRSNLCRRQGICQDATANESGRPLRKTESRLLCPPLRCVILHLII